MKDAADALVIGAGITGLVAAYRLRRRGLRVIVAEASPRTGGVVQSESAQGLLLEHGPFSVMARSGEFRQLITDLGLQATEADAGTGKRRYIQLGGRLRPVPTSPRSFIACSLLSPISKARIAAGMIRSRRAEHTPREMSIADAARRRFGSEAESRLIGPACVGVFAAEANELSLDACMPRIAAADREAGSAIGLIKRSRASSESDSPRTMLSFPEGLGSIIQRLEAELHDCLVTNAPVRSLTAAAAGDGDGFVADVGGRDVHARCVIVTTSAQSTATVVSDAAPLAAQRLRAIRYADLGVIHLGFDQSSIGRELDGFGYLVARDEPDAEPVLGVIWPQGVFPSHGNLGTKLIRVMVGGTRWPNALRDDDATLITKATAAIRRVLDVRGEPSLTRVVRWPASVPVYERGHAARVKSIQDAVAHQPGLLLAGSWVCGPTGGIGVNDRVRHASRVADDAFDALSRRRGIEADRTNPQETAVPA
ncbi:MAG: protoporphyrinogen oxidase [Planctomycetota bacterium]